MTRTLPLIFVIALLLQGCGDENRAPTLELVEDMNVVVGDELQVFLLASDPDGDPVTFTLDEGPEGARLEQQANQALFRWAPLITQAETGGKSYKVRVSVADSKGAFTAQEWTVTALFEGGVPTFITPSGHVVNMATNNSVAFLVEVKDDDDVTVELTMADAMDGALFQQVSGKVASFYWKPTQAQITESSFWSVTVTANDGVHPVVQFPLSIVLVNANSDSCPGNPPSIQHIALGDQHGPPPYLVTANATDAESGIESMTLQWRTIESESPIETAMSEISPGLFVGEIQSSPIPGSQAAVFLYRLVAKDNDDVTSQACDHIVSVPKAADLAFVAYGPDAPNDCKEDAFEPNESASTASPIAEGIHVALRNCGGDDWYSIVVPEGRSVVTTLISEPDHGALSLAIGSEFGNILKEVPFGSTQEVLYGPVTQDTDLTLRVSPEGPVAMTYALQVQLIEGGCDADVLEPNNGVSEAKKVGGGTLDNLLICPGDQDWFAIDLAAGDHLRLDLLFNQADGDLDMKLIAGDGLTVLASAITVTSDEVIEYDAYLPTTVYAVVSGFGANSNQYSLSVELSDQISGCNDDIVSPNQSQFESHLITEGTLSGLMACPGKPDYFKYTLNGGETVKASVYPELSTDSPVVRIESAGGGLLPGPMGSEGNSTFAQTTVNSAGPIWVAVQPLSSVAAPYTLDFQVTQKEGSCKQDRLEPNNVISSAKPVEGTVTSQLTLCEGDEDWLYLEVNAYSAVEIRAEFDDHLGSLNIELAALNGTPLTSAQGSNGNATLTTFIEEGGAYYIRVFGNQGVPMAYDLVTAVN